MKAFETGVSRVEGCHTQGICWMLGSVGQVELDKLLRWFSP